MWTVSDFFLKIRHILLSKPTKGSDTNFSGRSF
jgi:hypothetical protein